MNSDNVLGLSKKEKEEHSTAYPRAGDTDVPDLFHLNHYEEKDSQLLCNNSADICFIPSHSEVRKREVNILTRSHTINISGKFKIENSMLFRNFFVLLLNLMFEVFVSTTNEDRLLHMIGNLFHFLPSTCSCKSESCNDLQQLSSPITKSSQLNKFFRRSNELKSEFIIHAVKSLDWIFRKSKCLNERSIEVINDAKNIFIKSEKEDMKKILRSYILKWISFDFSEEKSIRETEKIYEKNNNKFIKTFIAVLVNSPFKETDLLEGRPIPLEKYLQYGSILQGAFNYISKNHRVRMKGTHCKCCICSGGFSSEDMKFIFMKNVCNNKVVTTKKENHEKIRKLINQNSSSPSYKNIKLTEFYQKFNSEREKDSESLETCEKRKNFHLSDSEPSVKSRKFNDKSTNSAIERVERERDRREASDSRGGRTQETTECSSYETSEIPGIYDRFAVF